MNQVRTKIKPTMKESLENVREPEDTLAEMSWYELIDNMAQDEHYEFSKVEDRGYVRKFTAGAAGALAVAAAATGRRRWAAGLGIYAATQLATNSVEKRIFQRRDNNSPRSN